MTNPLRFASGAGDEGRKKKLTYILSGFKLEGLAETRRAEFVRFVEQEVAALGRIHITKDSGMFEAW